MPPSGYAFHCDHDNLVEFVHDYQETNYLHEETQERSLVLAWPQTSGVSTGDSH